MPDRYLFDMPANRSRLQSFRCVGYEQPVVGTIYPRASLRWHGVPLGGLGTGYLCWNTDGRFGLCTIYNQVPGSTPVPDLNWVPFRVSCQGRNWLLAMRNEQGVGDLLDLRYFGHYPMADLQFDLDAPLAVEIRALAPFLPGDATESNTPAAVFQVRLSNQGDKPLELEITFEPPPTPSPVAAHRGFDDGSWQGILVEHPWQDASPTLGRQPLHHQVALVVENGRTGLGERGPLASFQTTLAPGASSETTFILAWYQPYLRDSWRRAERLAYADRFADALGIARYAIRSHLNWLRRIIRWQSAIYSHQELPAALREALVNSFYAMCKNSHWIARWRPDDWFPADGLFLLNESYSTCSLSETIPCHYLGSWPTLLFFPDLERTALEAYRHYQLGTGEVPFVLDKGFGARNPAYQVQHTNGIGEYIEIVHRYWLRTGDKAFLREFYPSVRSALGYLEFLDTDGDGLVNEHAHALPGEFWPANVPWDTWPQWGTSCYTGMKSLAACLSLARMAEEMGDEGVASRCLARAERGRKRYEELFWNGRYYRLWVDPSVGTQDETCLMAQTMGAWDARLLGLDDPVPAERIRCALESSIKMTEGLSAYGLVLAAKPDGSTVYSNQRLECDFPRDVWPSFNFALAATCLYYGVAQEDATAAALRVLETIFRGANAMPWGWPCNLNGIDGWIGHGHDYQDPQTIWTIPLAMAGQSLAHSAAPGSLVRDVLEAARR